MATLAHNRSRYMAQNLDCVRAEVFLSVPVPRVLCSTWPTRWVQFKLQVEGDQRGDGFRAIDVRDIVPRTRICIGGESYSFLPVAIRFGSVLARGFTHPFGGTLLTMNLTPTLMQA